MNRKPSWIKNTAKNLLTFIFGLFIGIIILEIFLRIYNRFQSRVKGDRVLLPANLKYEIKNTNNPKLDRLIIHTKNAIGFRGSEPPKDFDKYMTIITIGGSTTECFYLSDSKTWPHILEDKLSKNIKNLWINNAGLDGFSTFGQTILMEDYIIKRYKPKMILFLLGANDVGRKGFKLERTKITTGEIEFRDIRNFLKSLSNYSETANLVVNLYRFTRSKTMQLDHRQIDLSETIDQMPKDKADALLKHHIKDFLPLYKKRVENLIHLSRSNGIEPVLITQPALFGDAIDDITGVNLAKIKILRYDGGTYWKVWSLYNAQLKEIAKAQNVLVIDLGNEMPKSSKYFYDYCHYTNEGAYLVAEIVYRHLCPFIQKNFKEYCF